MTKEFASGYDITDEGWYKFPPDADYRKRLFPFLNLSDHPAKANLYMLQACVEYVSEPEQLILDPMSGTGSILVAALVGRRVMCMEIEKEYQRIIQQGIQCMDEIAPGASNHIVFIPSDCRLVMPVPVDHIIFSPPYGNILKKKSLDKLSAEMLGEGLLFYSKDPMNIGNLNDFIYRQEMSKVYKKCYDSLPDGGTLTIIIKNHIEQGKEVDFSGQARDDCLEIGFEQKDWFKWKPPGAAYTSFMRARGDKVVDVEDVVIMQKPVGAGKL